MNKNLHQTTQQDSISLRLLDSTDYLETFGSWEQPDVEKLFPTKKRPFPLLTFVRKYVRNKIKNPLK